MIQRETPSLALMPAKQREEALKSVYLYLLVCVCVCVCVCMRESVCVCVCGHVYVVYEDTNLYNDMGIT